MNKINNLEIYQIKIPLKKSIYLSQRCISHSENIIVKIESEGLYGWGESSSAPRMTGDTMSGMKEIIDRWIKPMILQKNIDNYNEIINQIDKTIYGNTGAKFAVYSAILDLYCRIKNKSLYEILGNRVRYNFQSLRILANETTEEDIHEAEECYKSGVDFFKIKIGKRNLDEEIQLIRDIRSIVRNSKICLDSNNGFNESTMKNFIKHLADLNILFIEQPFDKMPEDKIYSNICLDESIFSLDDIREAKKTAQGVNLKLIKFSDPFKLIKASQLSEHLNLKTNLSGKICETGIATNILLNCAAVIPNLDWGISTTNQYLLTDIIEFVDDKNLLAPVKVDDYLLSSFKYNDE